MKLDFAGFLGANIHTNQALLPEGVGVQSLNQAPGRGDLRPWRQPLTVASVPASPQRRTLFRKGMDTASDTLHWLSWTTLVHAIRGFDPEDTQERIYFTGAAGGPAWTDNTMALASAPYPTTSRPLGVPAPTTAPTLTVAAAGTSDTDETRFIVTTFVNDLGWESAPSPMAEITCPDDTLLTLSNLEAAPAGNYGINRRRIYFTESGATDATEFFFAAEVVYTGGGQSWTQTTTALTTDVLRTQGTDDLGAWLPCPADATCLTRLWNSMAACISGKAVRFCVAGSIYAWPYTYENPISDQPVALGTWGQNLLALTSGAVPSLFNGQDPASMSEKPLDELPFNASCQSVASVISQPHGVSWAGPDGACYIGTSGARVSTAGLIHPDQWRALRPNTMVGCEYFGLVVFFYDDGTGWKGLMLDPINPTGIFWLSQGFPAAYADPKTSAMFVLDGGDIRKWDAGAAFMTATFTSRALRTPSCNMAYGRVIADSYPVTLRLLGDGAVKATRAVANDDVFSLPDGYEAQVWQVSVDTAGPPITSIHIAQSEDELFE